MILIYIVIVPQLQTFVKQQFVNFYKNKGQLPAPLFCHDQEAMP